MTSHADRRSAQGARLRAERERRRWTKAEMARRLLEAIPDRQRPDHDTVLSYVKRWEAGRFDVSERYRFAYATAFDMDVRELFDAPRPPALWPSPVDPEERERLAMAVRNPAALDAAVVDSLAATLAGQRRIEDLVGSQTMVAPAMGHLDLILRLLKDARGMPAERLAATASEASQFVGWLYTATGAHARASRLYDQALRLGVQCGNDDLAATGLSMRGHLAWITGDVGAMADLSQAAADLAMGNGTRTMATQQKGRAMAMIGDRQAALRAVGEAEEILAAASGSEDPDGLYFYGPEMLLMQRGLIIAYLADGPAQYAVAAGLIGDGIAALPAAVRNSEWVAWYRAQAAAAWAASGDVEQSTAELRTAFAIAEATGGQRTLDSITKTARTLAERRPGHPDVEELCQRLN